MSYTVHFCNKYWYCERRKLGVILLMIWL